MPKTVWRFLGATDVMAHSTADMAKKTLISTERGQVECARYTAENAVNALGRLVETLHEKGLLTTDEVQYVLDMYDYEATEDEA